VHNSLEANQYLVKAKVVYAIEAVITRDRLW